MDMTEAKDSYQELIQKCSAIVSQYLFEKKSNIRIYQGLLVDLLPEDTLFKMSILKAYIKDNDLQIFSYDFRLTIMEKIIQRKNWKQYLENSVINEFEHDIEEDIFSYLSTENKDNRDNRGK